VRKLRERFEEIKPQHQHWVLLAFKFTVLLALAALGYFAGELYFDLEQSSIVLAIFILLLLNNTWTKLKINQRLFGINSEYPKG
jgi:hypothetical protein